MRMGFFKVIKIIIFITCTLFFLCFGIYYLPIRQKSMFFKIDSVYYCYENKKEKDNTTGTARFIFFTTVDKNKIQWTNKFKDEMIHCSQFNHPKVSYNESEVHVGLNNVKSDGYYLLNYFDTLTCNQLLLLLANGNDYNIVGESQNNFTSLGIKAEMSSFEVGYFLFQLRSKKIQISNKCN